LAVFLRSAGCARRASSLLIVGEVAGAGGQAAGSARILASALMWSPCQGQRAGR
jgi:hypothetical protein